MMRLRIIVIGLLLSLNITLLAQRDSVVYWKRHASVELFPIGAVLDFNPLQSFGNHIALGYFEITLGITKHKYPLILSTGLHSVLGRPVFDPFSTQKEMHITSFRGGSRLLKTENVEIHLTSGVGFMLNEINKTIAQSNIPGFSSTQLKVAYYPFRNIGIALGTNFFVRSGVSVLTSCLSISFRNGV